jgi:hypothetical protein
VNLRFAMDGHTIREIIKGHDIALCPIRQIGKTEVLLRHIMEEYFPADTVVVITHSLGSVGFVEIAWADITKYKVNAPTLIVMDPDSFLHGNHLRGKPAPAGIYFDEYMNLSEYQRTDIHELRNEYNFCGGTATYR